MHQNDGVPGSRGLVAYRVPAYLHLMLGYQPLGNQGPNRLSTSAIHGLVGANSLAPAERQGLRRRLG